MANMGDILLGIGAAAHGINEGLQTGFELQNRAKIVALQERQANLQSIKAFSEVMEPGMDPVVRKMALQNIIPDLGLPPEEAQQMADAANKLDDESRASFVEFLNNNPDIASGNIPIDVMAKQFLKDPMGTMKFIQDDITSREDRQMKKDQFGLDVQKFEHSVEMDEEQLGISRENLNINKAQLDIQAQVAQAEILNKAVDNRQKGLDALINASKLKDPVLRGTVVDKLNMELGLDMTPEELEGFKMGDEESLEDIKTRLEIETQALKLENMKNGFGATKTEATAFLELRATGKKSESMPKWIQEMDPADAKKSLDAVGKTSKLIDLGGLKTKSAFDKVTLQVSELSGVERTMDRLISIIEKNPETAGMLGTVSRLGQRAVGAVTSFDPLISGSRQDIKSALAGADPEVRSILTRVLFGKNIPASEVLETAARVRLSRALSGTSRVLKSDYEQARDMIDISGLVGDPEAVLTRLREVNNIIKEMKKDHLTLLQSTQPGTTTEDDTINEENFSEFMKELNGGSDEGTGEEEE